MAKVEIYSTTVCPYCVRAKELLKRKHIEFTEILVDKDETKRDEMVKRSGGKRTVPQIFINGESIGGCDDLYALDAQGKLDNLLM